VKKQDLFYLSLVFSLETIALYFALAASPREATLGELIRIFYIHTPAAWVAYLAFSSSLICTLLFFTKRNMKYDTLAENSAVLGVFFGAATILTGAVWAHAAWGSYWNWDPRETATLVAELAYVGYIMLRSSIPNIDKRAVSSGAYNVLAFSTVPLSYFSVDILNSLHPIVITATELNISWPILETLIVSLIAATSIFIYLVRCLYSLSTLSRAAKALVRSD
jgi:heme exporter protein C